MGRYGGMDEYWHFASMWAPCRVCEFANDWLVSIQTSKTTNEQLFIHQCTHLGVYVTDDTPNDKWTTFHPPMHTFGVYVTDDTPNDKWTTFHPPMHTFGVYVTDDTPNDKWTTFHPLRTFWIGERSREISISRKDGLTRPFRPRGAV
jgi:hypothetical protein